MNTNKVTPEEIEGIRKAIDGYVNAANEGDSKIAEAVFAPSTTVNSVQDGKIVAAPVEALYDFYNAGKQPASYEILDCNVSDNVAMVSIESKFGDASFIDMFLLMKDAEGWKIVAKAFHLK